MSLSLLSLFMLSLSMSLPSFSMLPLRLAQLTTSLSCIFCQKPHSSTFRQLLAVLSLPGTVPPHHILDLGPGIGGVPPPFFVFVMLFFLFFRNSLFLFFWFFFRDSNIKETISTNKFTKEKP